MPAPRQLRVQFLDTAHLKSNHHSLAQKTKHEEAGMTEAISNVCPFQLWMKQSGYSTSIQGKVRKTGQDSSNVCFQKNAETVMGGLRREQEDHSSVRVVDLISL
jgi:hypothetical protein